MTAATVIVPTLLGGARLERLLVSLDAQEEHAQVIVVDNGSAGDAVGSVTERHPAVEVLRLETNAGFARAVNLAARDARGKALVLVNDDCACDPGFVGALAAALCPGDGIVMAAGVLRDALRPDLIDTAGIQTDATLSIFDYLNGEPLTKLDQGVVDPIGPCGAAAAYDRDSFLECGGFDEAFFAYWEDVDLALRLALAGGRCVLVPGARGVHEHSTTLGSGSPEKNRLVGFGRGYLLRKWSVLRAPRRALQALTGDALVCAAQLVVDRSATGLRGRVEGYRAAGTAARHRYPAALLPAPGRPLGGTMLHRARRRARLRSR